MLRYQNHSNHCFHDDDDRVLQQLPEHVRCQFPWVLTARAAVDPGTLVLMRSMVVAGLPVKTSADVLNHLREHRHAEHTLRYYSEVHALAQPRLGQAAAAAQPLVRG